MDIIKELPQEDVIKLKDYLNWYGGSDEYNNTDQITLGGIPHFLRFWNKAKAPFYKMFGDKFIIKQEILFERDLEEMVDEMSHAIHYSNPLIQRFVSDYVAKVNRLPDSETRYLLKHFVSNATMLVENVYGSDGFTLKAEWTVDNHPLQINSGGKTVKMLGKIAKALGVETYEYECEECGRRTELPVRTCTCGCSKIKKNDGYEAFRRAHSLVLNQKKIKGNLCLSIHPLDFITMSDNNSGWSSCMAWMDEPGDYRLGTIEMMNSEYVIIAYVEAKDDMTICDCHSWNNKRWRQLIVITPELILGNKQYPYVNDFLQGAAMKWVRELAQTNEAYGPYETEAITVYNKHTTPIGDRRVRFSLEFGYMYNDIYDDRLAFLKRGFDALTYYKYLSGPAVCTCCGDVIECNDVEAHWTTCRSCSGMWRCAHCGDWCTGESFYVESTDSEYCSWCYHHELTVCEVCNERVPVAKNIFIELLPYPTEDLECYNWTYTIEVCDYCYQSDEFIRLFGETHITSDMWGRQRNVVSIDNITDEGFQYGTLNTGTINTLKEIRDAKSIEDRVSLIRKNLY